MLRYASPSPVNAASHFPEHGFPSLHAFLQLPSLADLTLYTTKKKSLALQRPSQGSFRNIRWDPPSAGEAYYYPNGLLLRRYLASNPILAALLKRLVLVGCGRWEKNRCVEVDAIPSCPRPSETFYNLLEGPMAALYSSACDRGCRTTQACHPSRAIDQVPKTY